MFISSFKRVVQEREVPMENSQCKQCWTGTPSHAKGGLGVRSIRDETGGNWKEASCIDSTVALTREMDPGGRRWISKASAIVRPFVDGICEPASMSVSDTITLGRLPDSVRL